MLRLSVLIGGQPWVWICMAACLLEDFFSPKVFVVLMSQFLPVLGFALTTVAAVLLLTRLGQERTALIPFSGVYAFMRLYCVGPKAICSIGDCRSWCALLSKAAAAVQGTVGWGLREYV